MNEMTSLDMAQLDKLEATIRAGKNTFVAVGQALMEIREKRLYRRDYDTFEAYCQFKWGWNAQRGRQLINAAAVVQSLPKEIGTTVPTERVAREIGKLAPDQRAEVVHKAVSGGTVTTSAIQKAASEISKDIELDETGLPIPDALVPLWQRRCEIQAHMTAISKMIAALKSIETNDPLWAYSRIQEVLILLDKAHASLSLHKPYAVCATCQGHPDTQPNNQCRGCKGTGFMSRYQWNAVDTKIKTIREKMITK